MNKKELMKLHKKAAEAAEKSKAAAFDDSISEEEFDKLVDAECEAIDALVDALVEFAGGMLSHEDANRLALRKFDEVGALIKRLAA